MTTIIGSLLLHKSNVAPQRMNMLFCFASLLAILTIVGTVAVAPAMAEGFVTPSCGTRSSLNNVPVEHDDAECQGSLNRLGCSVGRNTPAVAVSTANGRFLCDAGLAAFRIAPSIWPVLGRITGYFGHRLDPFTGKNAFHAGVDIASHSGDAVRATADGVIVEADHLGGYGRLIVIDHGFGVTTWYGHLSRFLTRAGTFVQRGAIIGYEGQSGRSTGTHLHYEVRINNTPVNPRLYLRDARPEQTVAAIRANPTGPGWLGN